jgi:Rrf2 family transcriptional regulator, iron-sulfur cluster assembly transcription factor
MLQALVRHRILRGVRGPRGGYELARERSQISIDEILRAADTAEEIDGVALVHSKLLKQIVMPALGQAEHAFGQALARISLDDLTRSAEGLGKPSQ